MDRMQPAILEVTGRCVTCGRVRCAAVKCFEAALIRREEPPILSRWAADRLIGRLVKVGWPRSRAAQRVGQILAY